MNIKRPITFIIPEIVLLNWQNQDFLSLSLETHSLLCHTHSHTGCTSERTIFLQFCFSFFCVSVQILLLPTGNQQTSYLINIVKCRFPFLLVLFFFFFYENNLKPVISISCYRLNIFKPPLNEVVNQTSFLVSTICTDRLLKYKSLSKELCHGSPDDFVSFCQLLALNRYGP